MCTYRSSRKRSSRSNSVTSPPWISWSRRARQRYAIIIGLFYLYIRSLLTLMPYVYIGEEGAWAWDRAIAPRGMPVSVGLFCSLIGLFLGLFWHVSTPGPKNGAYIQIPGRWDHHRAGHKKIKNKKIAKMAVKSRSQAAEATIEQVNFWKLGDLVWKVRFFFQGLFFQDFFF